MLEIGRHLSIEDALDGASAPRPLSWNKAARKRATASAARVARAVEKGEWIYGVTTGFGSNAIHGIAPEDAEKLQENLLVSHAFGAGEPFSDEARNTGSRRTPDRGTGAGCVALAVALARSAS